MLADAIEEENSNQDSNENDRSDHCCNAHSSTFAGGISCAECGRFTICRNTNNIEILVDVRTTYL